MAAAEFVIVGGGIYGAATALALATAGAGVLVLEASELAAGASGGLGKRGVRANGRDLREIPLMRQAYDLWPTLGATLGADVGYERIGHLQLYERHHDIGAADVRARVQTALGIPTTHLAGARLRQVEPGLSDKVLGALHAPLDGVADHVATTRAYAAAAQRAGAVTGATVARSRGALPGHRRARDRRVDGRSRGNHESGFGAGPRTGTTSRSPNPAARSRLRPPRASRNGLAGTRCGSIVRRRATVTARASRISALARSPQRSDAWRSDTTTTSSSRAPPATPSRPTSP